MKADHAVNARVLMVAISTGFLIATVALAVLLLASH